MPNVKTESSPTNRLIEIAERVEALAGPDDNLDAEIATAVVPPDWGEVEPDGARYNRRFLEWERVCMSRPTASLDAALTLVPEGWAATTIRFTNGTGKAIMWRDSFFDAHVSTNGIEAATPALALTAAALRSRAASPTQEPNQ